MPEWGTRYYGAVVPIKKDTVLVAGNRYQAEFKTPIDIPDAIEMPIIVQMRKLKDEAEGSETTYIYVKGRKILVQWYQRTASPITAGAVILGLMALSILVLAIGLVLVSIGRVVGAPAGSFLLGFGAVIVLLLVLFLVILPAVGITKPLRRKRK